MGFKSLDTYMSKGRSTSQDLKPEHPWLSCSLNDRLNLFITAIKRRKDMVKDRPHPESEAIFRSAKRLRWLPWFHPLTILIVAIGILLVVACGSTNREVLQS